MPPNSPNQPCDVFLSHNSQDKPAVEALAIRLTDEAGLQVWLDKWNLIPGEPWQEEIERALDQAHTCAVFLGPYEFGGWHHEEMRAALDQRVADRTRKFRVIPVLLPGATMPDRSKLPAFLARLTWVDFRQGLDDADAFRRLVAGIRGIAPGRAEGGVVPAQVECPYRGLEVFDEEHARFFFGREAMTQHLVEALRPTRFLCVLGPSGSGKSSLARAGLLPQLRAGRLPGSQHWQYLVFKPGAHPIEELALNLAALQGAQAQVSTAAQLIHDFKTAETALHLFARLLLRTQAPDTQLFLLVDQFEEVFTLCQDAAERAQFIKNLRYAGTIEGGRVVIVPTMRADFLARAAESPDLAELLSTHQFIVNSMEPDELRRAIEEPAQLTGLRFELSLVERILNDVGQEPGALPLLEHALRELFEKRSRADMLTAQAYEQSGGVQGALAQKAEAIYARFTPEQQTILRRVMLRLTQPGEGTADTRRRAALNEFWQNDEERATVENVIHTLADERLLTTTRDAIGVKQVDVAHEALVRGWPRLRNWIDEDRDGLRLHHRLSEDAKEWGKQGKDESYLYQGARLVQAVEWRRNSKARLNELEWEFLEAAVQAREAKVAVERARQKRSQRFKWTGVLVVLAFITVIAFLSWYLLQNEKRLRGVIYGSDMSLARVAFDKRDYSQGMELLVRYLPTSSSWVDFLEVDLRDETWQRLWRENHDEKATFVGHVDLITSVAFSPDGKTLASGSWDTMIKLWDTSTGQLLNTLKGHEKSVNSVAFAPDGKTLASGSSDHTVKLWNAHTGELLNTLENHEGAVSSVAFAPDGKTLASGSRDNLVKLWDAHTGELLDTLKGHEVPLESIESLAYAPDGRTLAIGCGATVMLRDVRTGKLLNALNAEGNVESVAYAPGGKTLACGRDYNEGSDYRVFLWNAYTGRLLNTLEGHEGNVMSVAFAPDGKMLASGSWDLTIKLWDVATCQQLVTLKGHVSHVTSVAFSPDGMTLASSSEDRTIKLWDVAQHTRR